MLIRYRYQNDTYTDFFALKKRLAHLSFPKPVIGESGEVDKAVVALFASLDVTLEVVAPEVPVKTLNQARAEKCAGKRTGHLVSGL